MRTIMLIEDSKYIRENTEEILQVAGYEVFTAADGQQGLADTAIKNPDLVLCDIAMPVMSGYDVLNALRSDIFLHHIPFIFLTCSSEEKDINTGLSRGADAFIIKPYDAGELLVVIELILDKRDHEK